MCMSRHVLDLYTDEISVRRRIVAKLVARVGGSGPGLPGTASLVFFQKRLIDLDRILVMQAK